MGDGGPSAHEIIYAVRPKQGHTYPLWQRPFFVLSLITNLHGVCRFHMELRLEDLEKDVLVQATDEFEVDLGNDPLQVQPVSIMIKAAKLPRAGVYRVKFVCDEETLANAIIHAR
jgi:hypothetical protein